LRRLLWVVDRAAVDGAMAPRVLRAGVRWLQLRDASLPAGEWLQHLEAWAGPEAALEVVVNGGPGWAREAGLGAHLKAAQPSLPASGRARWPLLGRSVHDPEETRRALADQPDYLVAGPVYPTTAKPGHPGIGTVGLAEIVEASAGVPVLAVGGLTPARVAEVGSVGASGVAVLSGITGAGEPVRVARDYLEALGRVFLPANTG